MLYTNETAVTDLSTIYNTMKAICTAAKLNVHDNVEF